MSPKKHDRVETLAATAAREVYEKTQGKRIVILYPRHRQPNALIALLYKHYSERMHYYALTQEDNNLKAFLTNLAQDATFPVKFGANVREAVKSSRKATAWAEALGKDLKTLGKQDFVLLLDNLDHISKADEIDKFFRELPQHMPNNAQLIVNGRELRRQPWNDLISSGDAVTLGDDTALDEGMFQEPAKRGQLEVYGLAGGSRVLIDGRAVVAWEGSLPRNLCYFFVDQPLVTRNDIFEVFWPNLGVREATNVFHVTKRKVSEKIGYDLTSFEAGFYVPNKAVNRLYDVATFEQHVEEAMDAEDEKKEEKSWLSAIHIYRGQFLKEVKMEWARQRRQELRDMYAQGLISLARIYDGRKESDKALGYYLRAVGEKPDREDVHRQIMSIYASQGQFKAVRDQYEMLQDVLEETLGIAPGQETRELYEKLISG